MKAPLLLAVIIVAVLLPRAEASLLSHAVRNTQNTVNKAVGDVNAEIIRAKERVVGSGGGPAATVAASKEIERLGEDLKAAKTEKIEAQDEKDVAHAGLIGLSAAILGGLFAMASTGMFGRHDRREKYLAAVLRELELDRANFDFSRLPKYQRLCSSKTGEVSRGVSTESSASQRQDSVALFRVMSSGAPSSASRSQYPRGLPRCPAPARARHRAR